VDGDLASAKFNLPVNLVITAGGDLLVTDQGNFAIRKISKGVVSTVAGNGTRGGADGPVATATLAEPYGITVTPDGTIYYADRGINRIRKISGGQVTTVAGGTTLKDGTGMDAGFDVPTEIIFAKDNNLYIVDQYMNSIRKMTLEGVVTTYAGALPSSPPSPVHDKDGPALEARFFEPTGICQGPDGSLYFSDQQNGKIKKISTSGNVTTLASNLNSPSGVAVAPDGTVYFLQASSLSKIMADGTVTTPGITGGSTAELLYPLGIAFASDGSMYLCDTNHHRIVKATRK
jgi:sugar lactone lactonase YvrE